MPTFRYAVDGRTVPSVTTIVGNLGENKRALMHAAWKLGMDGKNYREEWDKAARAGTAAHALAESHMHNLPEPSLSDLSPEERAGALDRFESLKVWLAQNKYQPVAHEVSMVSKLRLFGGTLDNVGLLSGKPALIDLKSKTLYTDQIIQVAGYRLLWDENHPDMPIASVHILGLSDGFHHHLIPESKLTQAEDAFLLLNALYHRLKALK